MLLSALYVRARDVRPIWDVVLQVLFYASPVFYAWEKVADKNETLAHLILFNPFAAILQQARHALIDPRHASAAEAIGGGWRLLVPAAIGCLLLVGGYAVFRRAAPRLAEDL
jgi:ABC-2 type transport system permease protein